MNTRAVALAAREPGEAAALELLHDPDSGRAQAGLPQLDLIDSAAVAAPVTAGDPLRLIVETVKRIEALLEQRYSATGRGLHTKVDSVREALPADLVKQLRWIATMRNKTMHEDGFVPDDMPRLHEAMLDCIRRLEQADRAAEPPASAKAASTASDRAAVRRAAEDDEAAPTMEPKKPSAASAKRDACAAADAAVAFRRLLLGLAACTAIALAFALS